MRRHLLLSAPELQSPIDDDEKLRPPPLDFASPPDGLFRIADGTGDQSAWHGCVRTAQASGAWTGKRGQVDLAGDASCR